MGRLIWPRRIIFSLIWMIERGRMKESMMSFDVDLFVIGGGSGGVRAARVAAAGGARVALAEEYRMGGTCVIRGCVPKKLMVYASGYRHAAADARAFGWDMPDGAFDWSVLHGRMRAELARLEGIYRRLLDDSGVAVHDARARVTGPQEVTLDSGEVIRAGKILIAVGGAPALPDLPGAELGITSNDIFLMERLPETILIVGGGYIASEFAGILNGLGVKVTQYYRGEQILRGFDMGCRAHIASGMIASGIDLQTGVNAVRLEQAEGGIDVTDTRGATRRFDQVLFATGRRPNTDGLGLAGQGVALKPNGAVVVDEYGQTAVPSIYAVGDVTDRVQLTPVAIREGMAFVETAFNDTPTKPDHHLIPTAIFTQPEMGTIGLTEEEGAAQGPVEIYETRFKPMDRGFAGHDEQVLMKLVVCAQSRKVLGCHIVAPHAGEMIQMVGIAVKMGATKEQFDQTCAVHPTIAEELVTMRDPARRLG